VTYDSHCVTFDSDQELPACEPDVDGISSSLTAGGAMNKNMYALCGAVLGIGVVGALWFGVTPSVLLFLLVCPLMMLGMMYFMMRPTSPGREKPTASGEPNASAPTGPRTLDGSHERIDPTKTP
jgi:hypothetical protein